MENQFNLKGKKVLVTGASSGIGKEIAITLSAAGADLIITGRNESKLNETYETLAGDNHHKIICDLTSDNDRVVLLNRLPQLNGVVMAAGVMEMQPVKFIAEDSFEQINGINYKMPVILSQQLVERKLLSPGASVVFITSIAAERGIIGTASYAGSKGALTAFARVFALEAANQKIRINCVAPGMVQTQMFERTAENLTEDVMRENEKQYPLGFVSAKDVANAALYLLSDASTRVTGITMTVDGGYCLK